MPDLPHFAYPFRFEGTKVPTTEQDSIDEIADAALTVLLCPLGYRVELPDFGISDPAFTFPVDTDAMLNAVAVWEPRADAVVEANPDLTDQLITRVQTVVRIRSEN